MAIAKLSDIEVYRDDSWYCGPGPSAVVYPDGEILVGFRRSRGIGHGYPAVEACIVRSSDGGQTWSEPEVFDYGAIRNINLTLLADGTLLMVTPSAEIVTKETYEAVVESGDWWAREAEGYYFTERGPYVRRSTDRGKTWSQPYYVHNIEGWPPVLPGFSAPLGMRGRLVELSDGTLVIPLHGRAPRDPSKWDRIASPVLVASDDGGREWSYRGVIATPQRGAAFNETEIIECPSGKTVAFMRPQFAERAAGTPNTEDMHIYTATSEDGGATWSAAQKEEVWGYPTSALRMSSGNVLLSYGYRREPFGIRALLTDPECESIGGFFEIVLRDDGGQRDLGYPQPALLPDGKAFVTYYMNEAGDAKETRYIAATIVEED